MQDDSWREYCRMLEEAWAAGVISYSAYAILFEAARKLYETLDRKRCM